MTQYVVSYRVVGTAKPYAPATKVVNLHEGSTDFSDIPKIVAIPRGLKPENIVITAAILFEEKE